jgi:hypothetical protein
MDFGPSLFLLGFGPPYFAKTLKISLETLQIIKSFPIELIEFGIFLL